jgi:uncharacterized protein
LEIRDPVHGPIQIGPSIIPLVEAPFFKRLRRIKQLGLSENIFPGATHSRFLHSLGVMHVGERAFERLFSRPEYKHHWQGASQDKERLKETFKLACLLHDVGHAPLSHSTEIVMPQISALQLPAKYCGVPPGKDRQATHEDYTLKFIIDDDSKIFFSEAQSLLGVSPHAIADLILGVSQDPAYFTVGDINFFPILHQLVSSELDCDRMDYLLRDSYFCGVSYGQFDLDWLLDNIEMHIDQKNAHLALNQRALITFEDFLLSRYHMFLMVYFHYRSVCLETLLAKFFISSPLEYQIPPDLKTYLEHDDFKLIQTLQKSQNPYAKKIIENRIPQKFYECYGKKDFIFCELENYAKKHHLDYTENSSSGRLSKYYREDLLTKPHFPISVIARSKYQIKEQVTVLEEATHLFKKFSSEHCLFRFHVDLNDIDLVHQKAMMNILNNSSPSMS